MKDDIYYITYDMMDHKKTHKDAWYSPVKEEKKWKEGKFNTFYRQRGKKIRYAKKIFKRN